MLVDRPAQIGPLSGHLDIGLIDEPPTTGSVAAWPRRLDEFRGKALDPPVDGDVVNSDCALGRQLLDVAVGQSLERKYQRTATAITSRGNRRPANTEGKPEDVTAPSPARRDRPTQQRPWPVS